MALELVRADCTNNHFKALESEWKSQLENIPDAAPDSFAPYMQHAKQIVSESPSDPRYAIYVLMDTGSGDAVYRGLVHINHAFPNSSQSILRMVWMLLAPNFDYEDPDPLEVGAVMGGFLYGALELCKNTMRSKSLKMHLNGAIDRRIASGVVSHMPREVPGAQVALRGSWLHIDNIS